MVSNAIEMDLQELLDTLERLRRDHAQDQDYIKLRAALPDEWPL